MLAHQWCNIKALPGANRLIKHLTSRDIPVALASNSPKEIVENKISFHREWKESFSVIIGGNEVRTEKPSPDIFLEAAKRLNAEPSSCLVIEDSIPGVKAGKAAGMAVIAVPSEPKQAHLFAEADEVVNSLLDFRPEKWGLPPFEDCKDLPSRLSKFRVSSRHGKPCVRENVASSFPLVVSGIEDTLPLEPCYIRGPVVKGFGRGSKLLGIPTANISTEGYSNLLSEYPSGVYFGWARLSTRGVFKMVMSIGSNPFFNNTEKTIEPWLLHDFEEDFYGEELRLVTVGYIRAQANFPSLESLVSRIHEDREIAERALDLPLYSKYRHDQHLRNFV